MGTTECYFKSEGMQDRSPPTAIEPMESNSREVIRVDYISYSSIKSINSSVSFPVIMNSRMFATPPTSKEDDQVYSEVLELLTLLLQEVFQLI